MKNKLFRSSVFLIMFMLISAAGISRASAAGYVSSGDLIYYVSGSSAEVSGYSGSSESLSIPSKIGSATVVSIGKEAFTNNTQLKKLVLPTTVKTIKAKAFSGCSNLTAMYIPSSVSSIASDAFSGCKKLTAYVIPGSYAEKYVKASSTVALGYRYATSVKLAASSAKLAAGSKIQTKYAVYPTNAYNKKVTFASSNTSVASISSTGVITAKKCGSTVITVTTADGSNKKAQAVIYVVPAKVTGLVQSGNTASGYTISWDKSNGATAYGVYRYNASAKKWELLKSVTGLYYTVTGLSSGSSAYYCILPYTVINGTNYKGAASDYLKASVLTPGKVSNVTSTSSDSAIKLSWDKAPNATGYQIYQYNEHTNSYTFLGKTAKLTATVKNLASDKKYVFAIRAYLMYGGETVLSNSYVGNIVAYTNPAAVTGFCSDPDSVTKTSVRLIWNMLKDVSGYELYSYNEAAASKYTLIAKLPHCAITGYTVDDIKSGEIKKFVIRAYSDKETLRFSPFSSVVTVQTATSPSSTNEAFNGFIDAFNASKSSTEDFYLISSTEVSSVSGLYQDECRDILNSIAETDVAKYYFEQGIETSIALPIGSYIAPFNQPSSLSLADVKGCEFTLDGSGYKITLSLNEENSSEGINSLIAPVINWDVVAGQHRGFELDYCLYQGTIIEAKVRNGKIDYMTVTMPIQYVFTYNSKEYTFFETIIYDYVFGW